MCSTARFRPRAEALGDQRAVAGLGVALDAEQGRAAPRLSSDEGREVGGVEDLLGVALRVLGGEHGPRAFSLAAPGVLPVLELRSSVVGASSFMCRTRSPPRRARPAGASSSPTRTRFPARRAAGGHRSGPENPEHRRGRRGIARHRTRRPRSWRVRYDELPGAPDVWAFPQRASTQHGRSIRRGAIPKRARSPQFAEQPGARSRPDRVAGSL